ncbi:hypothetical protein B0H10DRAFT_1964135 [Mycena sp. CBHHK59/15]|nr:hypothetical protein B0H10DRAFT_1964135 [Mycena sp. CBHHK59/15]
MVTCTWVDRYICDSGPRRGGRAATKEVQRPQQRVAPEAAELACDYEQYYLKFMLTIAPASRYGPQDGRRRAGLSCSKANIPLMGSNRLRAWWYDGFAGQTDQSLESFSVQKADVAENTCICAVRSDQMISEKYLQDNLALENIKSSRSRRGRYLKRSEVWSIHSEVGWAEYISSTLAGNAIKFSLRFSHEGGEKNLHFGGADAVRTEARASRSPSIM